MFGWQKGGLKGGIVEQKHTIFSAAALKDLLLVSVLADEAIDGDLLALPNSVAPSHSLQIILQCKPMHILVRCHIYLDMLLICIAA